MSTLGLNTPEQRASFEAAIAIANAPIVPRNTNIPAPTQAPALEVGPIMDQALGATEITTTTVPETTTTTPESQTTTTTPDRPRHLRAVPTPADAPEATPQDASADAPRKSAFIEYGNPDAANEPLVVRGRFLSKPKHAAQGDVASLDEHRERKSRLGDRARQLAGGAVAAAMLAVVLVSSSVRPDAEPQQDRTEEPVPAPTDFSALAEGPAVQEVSELDNTKAELVLSQSLGERIRGFNPEDVIIGAENITDRNSDPLEQGDAAFYRGAELQSVQDHINFLQSGTPAANANLEQLQADLGNSPTEILRHMNGEGFLSVQINADGQYEGMCYFDQQTGEPVVAPEARTFAAGDTVTFAFLLEDQVDAEGNVVPAGTIVNSNRDECKNCFDVIVPRQPDQPSQPVETPPTPQGTTTTTAPRPTTTETTAPSTSTTETTTPSTSTTETTTPSTSTTETTTPSTSTTESTVPSTTTTESTVPPSTTTTEATIPKPPEEPPVEEVPTTIPEIPEEEEPTNPEPTTSTTAPATTQPTQPAQTPTTTQPQAPYDPVESGPIQAGFALPLTTPEGLIGVTGTGAIAASLKRRRGEREGAHFRETRWSKFRKAAGQALALARENANKSDY